MSTKTAKEMYSADVLEIANIIHHMTCNGNHTDWCDWLYSSWDSLSLTWARKKALESALKYTKKGGQLEPLKALITSDDGNMPLYFLK